MKVSWNGGASGRTCNSAAMQDSTRMHTVTQVNTGPYGEAMPSECKGRLNNYSDSKGHANFTNQVRSVPFVSKVIPIFSQNVETENSDSSPQFAQVRNSDSQS